MNNLIAPQGQESQMSQAVEQTTESLDDRLRRLEEWRHGVSQPASPPPPDAVPSDAERELKALRDRFDRLQARVIALESAVTYLRK